MTREELQSAIQDFWDEAFHYSKHKISDTSKAIALECMMDAAEHKRTCSSTNADRIRAMSDDELAIEMGNHAIATICDIVCQGECNAFATLNRTSGDVCKGIIMEWLQQSAEEE